MTEKKAIFIDIDHTLIRGTAINLLAQYAYKRKVIPLRVLPFVIYWYFLYKMNYIQEFSKIVHKTSRLLHKVLGSIPASDIEHLFKDCFDHAIKPRIYPSSVGFLNDFKKKGYQIYFVSSTFESLAKLIRNYYGFGEVVATQLVIKNGFFTGEISGEICYGHEKLRRIENIAVRDRINLKQSYAFSDHISDIPMLEKVGHPVVINPQKKFQKLAQKKGWEIRRLTL